MTPGATDGMLLWRDANRLLHDSICHPCPVKQLRQHQQHIFDIFLLLVVSVVVVLHDEVYDFFRERCFLLILLLLQPLLLKNVLFFHDFFSPLFSHCNLCRGMFFNNVGYICRRHVSAVVHEASPLL
jgi:hypothetical protein